jgi:mannose-6-phosphate isomerase-like protein (cupin superfamily)
MARGTLKAKSAKSRTFSKAKPAAAAKKKRAPRPAASRKPRPKQKFAVSHHREADFAEGLRNYAKYRDLGIAAATGGMVQAHVIRFVPPFEPKEASTPHYHDVDFQMVYVLKGWFKTEFEDEGVHIFEAGSCWIQPPGIKHAVRGYSDDCELLEIILPADFGTETVDSL